MIRAIRKAIAKHRLAKTPVDPAIAALEAALAARKARRLPQQAEAKQRYWAGQRKQWANDPMRGGV